MVICDITRGKSTTYTIKGRKADSPKKLYKILGPVSSRLITKLSQSKQTVFSSDEAAKILKTDNKQMKKLLHDLVKKGWLERIEKGGCQVFS